MGIVGNKTCAYFSKKKAIQNQAVFKFFVDLVVFENFKNIAMKKIFLIIFLFLFSFKGICQKNDTIKVTTEQKYTIIGDSIIEKDTIKISKNKLLKIKKDSLDRNIRTFVIEYDFQTGKFPDRKRIKPRVDVPVVFKIININRLAYTVKVTSKDSIIGFSDLSGLKLLLKKDDEEKIAENIKKTEPTTEFLNNILPVNKNDFIYNELKKEDKLLTSKEAEVLVNEINTTNRLFLEKLNTKINELNADNKLVKTKLQIDSTKLKSIVKEKFAYHFAAQNDLANTYLLILQKHHGILQLWNDFLQVNTIINNPLLNIKDLERNNKVITDVFDKFNKNRNILNDFNLAVTSFQNQYKTLKENPEITNQTNYGGSIKLFNIVDHLNSNVEAIKKQIDAVKFDDLKQNIDQINTLLLVNEDKNSLFEYVSDPIQPNQDVAIFNVKVDKNNKDASLFYNERNFSYKAFTRHGIRFDLNLGLVGSFHKKNDTYLIKADSLGVNRITNTNSSGFSPSFVGFFTTSYRSSTHFTGGLSVGLGVSADNGTIALDNFFIGPSLIVGRYERVNLTAGVSLKNLPKLNGNFREGQEVSSTTTIEAVTTKSYQSGFFIALTYNLTKGVKNNVKQIKNFF
jgi:hypothetical protein